MIICEPNKFVGEVHDRMPVLLVENDFERWLSGAAGLELLKPTPEDLLQKWPVSKRVNSSKAPDDDPTLIDRLGAKNGTRRHPGCASMPVCRDRSALGVDFIVNSRRFLPPWSVETALPSSPDRKC